MRGNRLGCTLVLLLFSTSLTLTGCLDHEESQGEVIITTSLLAKDPPLLNTTTMLTYNITAIKDLSDEDMWANIILPDGLLLIEGNTTWNGSLSQGESKIIKAKIKSIRTGTWEIKAFVGLRDAFHNKIILEKDIYVIQISDYLNVMGFTLANAETYGYKGIYTEEMNSPDIILTVYTGNALDRKYSTNITRLDVIQMINRLVTSVDFNHSDYGVVDGVVYIEGFFSLLREINNSWQLKVMSGGMMITTPIGEGLGIFANQNQVDSIIRQIPSDYKDANIIDSNDDGIFDTSYVRMKIHSTADKDEIISKLTNEIREIEQEFSEEGDLLYLDVEAKKDGGQNILTNPLVGTMIITAILLLSFLGILRKRKSNNIQ